MSSLRSHSSTTKGLFKLSQHFQEVVGMGYHKLPSLPAHWIYQFLSTVALFSVLSMRFLAAWAKYAA